MSSCNVTKEFVSAVDILVSGEYKMEGNVYEQAIGNGDAGYPAGPLWY